VLHHFGPATPSPCPGLWMIQNQFQYIPALHCLARCYRRPSWIPSGIYFVIARLLPRSPGFIYGLISTRRPRRMRESSHPSSHPGHNRYDLDRTVHTHPCDLHQQCDPLPTRSGQQILSRSTALLPQLPSSFFLVRPLQLWTAFSSPSAARFFPFSLFLTFACSLVQPLHIRLLGEAAFEIAVVIVCLSALLGLGRKSSQPRVPGDIITLPYHDAVPQAVLRHRSSDPVQEVDSVVAVCSL